MPSDYSNLSLIHNEIGMGEFARQMTGHLMNYAQQNNWLGRQIMEVGCGTGESLLWLTQHGYIVSGIDQSPEMLAVAKQTLGAQHSSVQLIESDFRRVATNGDQDMVLALNVLNELNSIREVEHAFKHVHGMLRENKWFVFDFYTVEGLYRRNDDRSHLEYDGEDLSITVSNRFDYDKSIQTRDYLIFKREGTTWQRHRAQRVLRSYAIQGITALVKRCGFDLRHVLTLNMVEYNPADSVERVIIYAEKQ
ncbi:MAG: class I SAM-dependent methyltransferase [Chloroflexota bacterium]